MKPSSDKLKNLARAVVAQTSINFPELCEDLDMNWFKDVRPLLRTDPAFHAMLKESLERLKYTMLDGLLKIGVHGKKGAGRDPEIAFVNAIVKAIDSGVLLGEADSSAGGGDSHDLTRHLNRLGLQSNQKDE